MGELTKVHTWGWEGSDARVRLRHSGLTNKGVEADSEGWDRFVPELAKAAAA